ncbi:MAG: KilA-N domain-containing protein [Bacteroidales bacterium]|nr:KilA-N domain-containing protein [Bacteroidales bacterium]
MIKCKRIEIHGTEVTIDVENNNEYVSLTDIARYKDPERSDYILQNWMRNRSTIEFIGLWELFNNPIFNSIEFDGIKLDQLGARL